MDEVNRKPDLLPNSSFVFGCPDGGCAFGINFHSDLKFSEEVYHLPPNYICNKQTMCEMVLTGPNLPISVMVRTMFNLFIPQQVRFCNVSLPQILILPL